MKITAHGIIYHNRVHVFYGYMPCIMMSGLSGHEASDNEQALMGIQYHVHHANIIHPIKGPH